MSIDYDAHRPTPENEPTESLSVLKTGKTSPGDPVIDLDETEHADISNCPGQTCRTRN